MLMFSFLETFWIEFNEIEELAVDASSLYYFLFIVFAYYYTLQIMIVTFCKIHFQWFWMAEVYAVQF